MLELAISLRFIIYVYSYVCIRMYTIAWSCTTSGYTGTRCLICRNRENDERQPLLGDPPPQPPPRPHVQPIEENNDSFDRAEWARRVLEQPFIGPRWASPVARVIPLPQQKSGSESTASSKSRLFDALIEAPALRKRVSSEGSLDWQCHWPQITKYIRIYIHTLMYITLCETTSTVHCTVIHSLY